MTESKSTRDYIKNWGRTQERVKRTKSFECYFSGLHIGRVTVQWSEDRQDWVWMSVMNFDTATRHNTCMSQSEATDWVTKSYLTTIKCMGFGRWLKIMCKRQQWTQAGLAERIGVSRVTVNHWISGRRLTYPVHYNHIASLFAESEQMSVSDLLGHMSMLFNPRGV